MFKFFYFLCLLVVAVKFCRGDGDTSPDRSASTRIVGGTVAAPGEYPAQISLQKRNRFPFCGGTLIDESHVLTAAHCVTTDSGFVNSPSTYIIMGGSLTVSSQINLNNQTRDATHVFVHPSYNSKSMLNDVAVIRVSSPFVSTSTFHTATRIQSKPPSNYNCSVAGWGTTSTLLAKYINSEKVMQTLSGSELFWIPTFRTMLWLKIAEIPIVHCKDNWDGPEYVDRTNGDASNVLLRVNVLTIDHTRCNRAYGGGISSTGMICAGTDAGGKDSCQGDSGGGLYCGNFVAGIVSFGADCGDAKFPGVYTNIAAYNDWIDSTLVWNNGSHNNIPTPTTRQPGGASTICISVYTLAFSVYFVLTLR